MRFPRGRVRGEVRQRDMIVGLANGKAFKEIAWELGLSVATIEYHWGQIKVAFEFRSPLDAVRYAIRVGWVKA